MILKAIKANPIAKMPFIDANVAKNVLKTPYPIITALIWPLLSPCLLWAGQLQPQLKITEQATGIHIQAEQVPLASVMKRLATTSGISLHYLSGSANLLVTGDCEGTALNALLSCLLRSPVNMVARYSAQGKAAEVWLLDINGGEPSVAGSSLVDIEPSDVGGYEEGEDLLELAQSKDPLQRSQAIANMAVSELKDPVLAKKVLAEALNDGNPEIRAKAVASLSRVDSANARPQLLQMLADKEAAVRLSTVVAAYNDPVVLQQAQNDSDAQVRMLAEISLNKLNNSNNKN